MEIYLAILEDSHIDTRTEPFITLDRALMQVESWTDEYDDEWEEETNKRWEYYIRSTCDDGPKIRVERKKLK